MSAFRQDTRAEKVDLGVGVYRNEQGLTPIMAAVKAAEQQLLLDEETKVYEGPAGNQRFCSAIADLVFGDLRSGINNRLSMVTTPGGCGALYLALQLLKRGCKRPTVWVSNPTWPNHIGVVQSLNMDMKTYYYAERMETRVDLDAMLASLSTAAPGDVLIVQGPCHNPTGIDLTIEQFYALGEFLAKKGVVPLIDIAYHGLGDSLDEDTRGVNALLGHVGTACLSYSCSKNFGLYRERTGCLFVASETPEKTAAVLSHLNDIARSCYSMPPAHGAAIVDYVLSNKPLRRQWEAELQQMRKRIKALRETLAAHLVDLTNDESFHAIAQQKGMFSLFPLTPGIAKQLLHQAAIYMPQSGRANIAGISAKNIAYVARAIADFAAIETVS